MIVYRADTRGPEAIQGTGFVARKPMKADEARKSLLQYCGGPKGTPNDLTELIIRSPQPEYVSTDLDEACGGYTHRGFVYKIEIGNLTKREWSNTVLGDARNLKPSQLWPALYLDADTLERATTIALQHNRSTKEVTFLTGIPAAKVVAVKGKDKKSFEGTSWTK